MNQLSLFFSFYSYPVMLGIALSLYFVFSKSAFQKEKSTHGFCERCFRGMFILGLMSSWLGAKLLYFAFHSTKVWEATWEEFLLGGGFVFHGALIGFLLFMSMIKFFNKKFNVNIMFIYLPLAHAVGRLGCHFAGCCYGRDGHHVQLYESGLMLLLFMILYRLRKNQMIFYLIGSGFIRFFTEFFRGDYDDSDRIKFLANMSYAQSISLVLVLVGLFLYARGKKVA